MAEPNIIHALKAKQAEIAIYIAATEKRLKQVKTDLARVATSIRLFEVKRDETTHGRFPASMPRSNRLSHAPGRGHLIGAIVLSLQGGSAFAELPRHPVTPTPHAQARQEQSDARVTSPAPVGQQASQEHHTGPWDYQRPCQYPGSREEADLCQQWRSAQAAEEMGRISESQLFWTWINSFGLLLSIGFTAWAAIAAGRAARAADEAVRISDQTARRELRAYVVATPIFLSSFNVTHNAIIRVRVENVGSTPAHNMRQNIRMGIFEYPTPEDYTFPPLENTWSAPTVLFPNAPRIAVAISGAPYSDEIITLIRAGSHRVFVIGEIRYEDIFGQTHFTRIGSSATGTPDTLVRLTENYLGTDLELSFEAASHHNEAD